MAISERIRCMEGVPVHPALWVIDDVTPQFRGFARGLLMTTVRRAVVVLRDGSHGAQRPRLDATARSAREKLPYKNPYDHFHGRFSLQESPTQAWSEPWVVKTPRLLALLAAPNVDRGRGQRTQCSPEY